MSRRLSSIPLLLVALISCATSPTQRLLDEGDARYEEGDLDGALKSYEEASRLSPRNDRAHYSVAEALYAVDRWAPSLAAVERALSLEPARPEYHHLRGNALIRLERFDDALDAYERAIELDPGFARAYYAMGIAHYNLRDYPAAVHWLERYLRIAPRSEDRERVQALIDFLE